MRVRAERCLCQVNDLWLQLLKRIWVWSFCGLDDCTATQRNKCSWPFIESFGIITYSLEVNFGESGFGTFKEKQLSEIPAPRNINKNAQKTLHYIFMASLEVRHPQIIWISLKSRHSILKQAKRIIYFFPKDPNAVSTVDPCPNSWQSFHWQFDCFAQLFLLGHTNCETPWCTIPVL